MATTVTYNTARINLGYVYQASSGGTVFSANLTANAAFDYFSDAPAVNDAIYFGITGAPISNIYLNIGTAMAGIGIVLAWECYNVVTSTWTALHNLTDGSNGFAVTGAVRVRFPVQAGMWIAPVNGIASTVWVRCRIVSFTTVTEGGANQTTRAQISNGEVEVTGSSDGSPAHFSDIYTYLNSNAPECLATSNGNIYTFPCCFWKISSRLVSQNEVIMSGCGAYQGSWNMSYLTVGTKVGTDGYAQASSFFFCGYAQARLVQSDNTKVYGGVFGWALPTVNGQKQTQAGTYLNMNVGEWIKPTFLGSSGYFQASLVSDGATMPGGIIFSSFPSQFPSNMRISNTGTNVGQLYGVGAVGNSAPKNITYNAPTQSVLHLFHSNSTFTLELVNFSPALYDQSETLPVGVSRASAALANVTKCLTYFGGVFADVTNAANNVTTDDVLLPVTAGDILYLYHSSEDAYCGIHLDFTITSQVADGVYVWEYWNGSVWVAVENFYDTTANFTVSGRCYLGQTGTLTSTTVNGVAALWYRCRCSVSGTGTPKFSRVQISSVSVGINTAARIYEKYTLNLTCIGNGAAVNGAQLTFTDSAGIVQTAVSNSSGIVPTVTVPRRYFAFNPLETDANFNVSAYTLSPVTVRARKYGFYENVLVSEFKDKFVSTITFTPYLYLVATESAAGAMTGITITGATSLIQVSSAHTDQDVLDRANWWAEQASNMGYAVPIRTLDGINITGSFTLVCSSYITWIYRHAESIRFDTPGTYAPKLGVTTLTFTAAGTYDLRGANLAGTITLVNASSGSVIVKLLPGVGYVNSGPSITVVLSHDIAVTAPNIPAGASVLLQNMTLSTELDLVTNIAAGGYSKSMTIEPGGGARVGDTLTLKAYLNSGMTYSKYYESVFVVQSAGDVVISAPWETWPEANELLIDGSAVTDFVADYPHIQVDIKDGTGTWWGAELVAFTLYVTMLPDGMREFFGAWTAQNSKRWIVDVSLADYQIDNLSALSATQSDDVVLSRSDGTSPCVQPTTGGGGISTVIANDLVRSFWGDPYSYPSGSKGATLAAVKAKTDLIPADPAGNSEVETIIQRNLALMIP